MMNASQRSMAIWKRISPGMLPDTAQTPTTTSQDAFAYDPQLVDTVRLLELLAAHAHALAAAVHP
jgi:hypothetical protein